MLLQSSLPLCLCIPCPDHIQVNVQCQNSALRLSFGLASLDALKSLYVLLAWQFCFFLVIYLLPCWASMASAHPWFVLLEPPVQGWMDRSCFAHSCSTLWGFVPLFRADCREIGLGVEVWFLYRIEGLREELTDSNSVDAFAPWSKSCFPQPPSAVCICGFACQPPAW